MLLFNLLTDPAASGAGTGTQKDPMTWVFIGVVSVAIVGLLVWNYFSSKKRQKEAIETVNKLKIGDRVKTIGGICGFVAEINDAENTFVLETGTDENKCFIKFDKAAIYQTAPKDGYANATAEEPAKEAPAIEEAKTEEVFPEVSEEAPAEATLEPAKEITEEAEKPEEGDKEAKEVTEETTTVKKTKKTKKAE